MSHQLSGPFGGIITDPRWGLVLVAALFFAAAGAAWRARGPGGVTADERRAHRPERRGAIRLMGLLTWMAPWVIASAAAFFVYPFRATHTVILVSRSRLQVPMGAHDPWKTEVAALKAGLARRRVMDAGTVVAEVLRRLESTMPPGGFVAGDPQTEAQIARSLQSVLVNEDVAPAVIDPASFEIPPVAATLPRWVVESVEISVLRALTRRYSVNELYAVVSGRRSAIGPVWGGVRSFLEATSERGFSRRVVANIKLVPEQPPVTLRSVIHSKKPRAQGRAETGCDDGIRVDFAAVVCAKTDPVCGKGGAETVMDFALVRGGQQLTSKYARTFHLEEQPRVTRESICFQASPSGDFRKVDLREVTIQTSAPVQSLPLIARSDKASIVPGQIQLRILSTPENIGAWEKSVAAIREPNAIQTSRAVADWQSRMEKLGFNLAGKHGGERLSVDIDDCSTSDRGSGDVTLNACGDGLWIYPSSLKTRLRSIKLSSVDKDEILRMRSTPSGVPGSDSWNGLALARGSLWRPENRGFASLAEATVLSRKLSAGSFPTTNRLVPIVSRQPLTSADGYAPVTFIGFNPEEQGVFVGSPTLDPERFLAIWTQIIEASYVAAGGPGTRWSTDGSDDQPYPFLEGADLARISGRGLWVPFIFLALGTLLHVVTIVIGLRSLPEKHQPQASSTSRAVH